MAPGTDATPAPTCALQRRRPGSSCRSRAMRVRLGDARRGAGCERVRVRHAGRRSVCGRALLLPGSSCMCGSARGASSGCDSARPACTSAGAAVHCWSPAISHRRGMLRAPLLCIPVHGQLDAWHAGCEAVAPALADKARALQLPGVAERAADDLRSRAFGDGRACARARSGGELSCACVRLRRVAVAALCAVVRPTARGNPRCVAILSGRAAWPCAWRAFRRSSTVPAPTSSTASGRFDHATSAAAMASPTPLSGASSGTDRAARYSASTPAAPSILPLTRGRAHGYGCCGALSSSTASTARRYGLHTSNHSRDRGCKRCGA